MARAARRASATRRGCASPRCRCSTRSGGEERFDKVVVITAPEDVRRARSRVGDRRARAASASRRGEDREGRLRLREHGHADGARPVRRVRDGRFDEMRRACRRRRDRSSLALAGVAALRDRDEPAVVRADPLPAPLHRDRARAREGRGDRPGAARGGDLPGVEVPPGRALDVGRDRADAAHARRPRRGSRSAPAGRRSRSSDLTDPAINIRYGTWYLHDLFAKYGSLRLVLAAYNAGQGNVDRWRAAGRGDPVPGDARLRRTGRAPASRSTATPGARSSTRRSTAATADLRRCASRRKRTMRSGRWSSWPRPAEGP